LATAGTGFFTAAVAAAAGAGLFGTEEVGAGCFFWTEEVAAGCFLASVGAVLLAFVLAEAVGAVGAWMGAGSCSVAEAAASGVGGTGFRVFFGLMIFGLGGGGMATFSWLASALDDGLEVYLGGVPRFDPLLVDPVS